METELHADLASMTADLLDELRAMETRLRAAIRAGTRTILLGIFGTAAVLVGAFAGLLTVFAH